MVLSKYLGSYCHCADCECLFVEQPMWLEEAYEEALNVYDTGAVSRTLTMGPLLAGILALHCESDGPYLDFAGGYGLLARYMRDIGFDYFWTDEFAKNLFARGFEGSLDTNYVAVSAFELFEHLPDPVDLLERLGKITDTIVFSTELWAGKPPEPDVWRYYGFEHGQHVIFYSARALGILADRFGYHFFSDGHAVHVLTKRPDPQNALASFLTRGRIPRRALPAGLLRGPNRFPWSLRTARCIRRHELFQHVSSTLSSRTLRDHQALKDFAKPESTS